MTFEISLSSVYLRWWTGGHNITVIKLDICLFSHLCSWFSFAVIVFWSDCHSFTSCIGWLFLFALFADIW